MAEKKLMFLFRGEVTVSGVGDKLAVSFLSGIPARDLTEEDWELLDDGQQERVRRSGLYEVVEVFPTAKGAKNTKDIPVGPPPDRS